jgi:hypothetical protein
MIAAMAKRRSALREVIKVPLVSVSSAEARNELRHGTAAG